jgi:hypothetical protein
VALFNKTARFFRLIHAFLNHKSKRLWQTKKERNTTVKRVAAKATMVRKEILATVIKRPTWAKQAATNARKVVSSRQQNAVMTGTEAPVARSAADAKSPFLMQYLLKRNYYSFLNCVLWKIREDRAAVTSNRQVKGVTNSKSVCQTVIAWVDNRTPVVV